MKISVLISIARQVEGEYVFIKPLKANINSDKLHRFLRENDLPQAEVVNGVDCVVEYGVLENLEVDES